MSSTTFTTAASYIVLPVSAGLGLGIMLIGYLTRFNGVFQEMMRLDARRIEKQRELTGLHKKKYDAEKENGNTEGFDAQIRIAEARMTILNDQFGIVMSRYHKMKFTVTFIGISLALLFLGSLWVSLANYWDGFWYFAVVCFFLALGTIFTGVFFAILELSQAFLVNESEWNFVQGMFPDAPKSKTN